MKDALIKRVDDKQQSQDQNAVNIGGAAAPHGLKRKQGGKCEGHGGGKCQCHHAGADAVQHGTDHTILHKVGNECRNDENNDKGGQYDTERCQKSAKEAPL